MTTSGAYAPPARRTRRSVAALATLALVAGGTAALGPAAPAVADTTTGRLCRSDVFVNAVSRQVVYRIPALVTTTRGTLVAFAERRRDTSPASDVSDTEVVVSRSTDRGCTWSTPVVVGDDGKGTVGNPAPLVDTTTGDVLLFTVDRPPGVSSLHGLHLQRSSDDGVTFTPYDQAGHDLSGLPHWSGGLTGPGHAIQLHAASSPHPGRLVVPIGYWRNQRAGAYGIVSDDHGKTWQRGWDVQGDDERMEGTLAELPDGRLWISYRSHDSSRPLGTGRFSTFSLDGGSSLQRDLRPAGLPVVAVQGSALALTGTHAGTLLFSSPTATELDRRHAMGVFASTGATAGTDWGTPYDAELESRPASYSDLAQIDDDTVGVLWETGEKSWHERITFRALSVADMVERPKVAASLVVKVPTTMKKRRELKPTLLVTAPGTDSPAGTFTARVEGHGVDRSVELPLYGDSYGRRVAQLGRLTKKGRYTLTVRYTGTSRIRGTGPTTTTVVVA